MANYWKVMEGRKSSWKLMEDYRTRWKFGECLVQVAISYDLKLLEPHISVLYYY